MIAIVPGVSPLAVPHRPGGELLKRHAESLLERLLRVKLLYCPVGVADKGSARPGGDFKDFPVKCTPRKEKLPLEVPVQTKRNEALPPSGPVFLTPAFPSKR